MALNLWKLGGKPTSYNPLPTGYSNRVPVVIGDIVVTFKAKSQSNAKLRVWSSADSTKQANFNLTNTLTQYSDTIQISKTSDLLFEDTLSKGDIIIEDIQLVEKPLPKLTINGIDGFLSGKWSIHPNAKIIDDETLELNASSGSNPSFITLNVIPNTDYSFTCNHNAKIGVYKTDGATVIYAYTSNNSITFNSGSNSVLNLYLSNSGLGVGKFTFKRPMLNLGSIPAPYEPKKGDRMWLPTKPKKAIAQAKKGLVMDGVSNYLQLPSMTMDSVEIDCLIDSRISASPALLDARTGLSDGIMYAQNYTFGSGFSEVIIDGQIKTSFPTDKYNKRIKVFAKASKPFTDDVTIFNNYMIQSNTYTRGILYGVKCFLNGQVVAEYDFTNPNNIVGDKVFQKVKNLIPSFEDSRWSLHPNFKVLGKDVGRLDATASFQSTTFDIDVKPNDAFIAFLNTSNTDCFIRIRDKNNAQISSFGFNGTKVVMPANATSIQVVLRNGSNPALGTFDFIKPQLYELDGKEGTLFGNPVIELKAPKQLLYPKR